VNLLLLGHGKTGALVETVVRERGHQVRVITSAQNPGGAGLTPDAVRDVDVVLDFTTPGAVVKNIEACVQARKNMVVGTTGWYADLPRLRALVEQSGVGFVYASNFSVGMNLLFEIARVAASVASHGYFASIVERHHIHKKDAPSGTAVMLQNILREHGGGATVEITSIREGEFMGEHAITLESGNDVIRLEHQAKSRRGYAEGAVLAAEWVRGRSGFFEFKDVLGSAPAAARR
jgi:4-hydroxy-tetrahydrodipicolinate reductase